jgi:proteasome lid subunit RPN8/RPN11
MNAAASRSHAVRRTGGYYTTRMASITSSALAAIQAHARAAYPEECCGLLLAAPAAPQAAPAPPAPGPDAPLHILDAIPAQNLAHANRSVRFTLDPRAYIHADGEARRRGLIVVGCYHSHPDHPAVPSATDASLAWDDFLYLILPLTDSAIAPPRVWRYLNNAPVELPLATPPSGDPSRDNSLAVC